MNTIFVAYDMDGNITSLSVEPSLVVEARLARGEPIIVLTEMIDPSCYSVDVETQTLVERPFTLPPLV